MIDGDTTPALPAELQGPGGMGQLCGEEGLAPASRALATADAPAEAPAGVMGVPDWAAAVGELEERTTVLHVRARGEDVDHRAIGQAIIDAHRPEGGVGDHGDGIGLVMMLPDGLGWATVLATAEGALPEGATVTAGLADAGGTGQALAVGVRLAERAARDAAERGERAMARSLADENAEAHEDEVVKSLVASLESGTGLRLVFQPRYDARETSRMVGAEALLRHECEHLGNIGPAEFLPIAERAGIRSRVESWVIDAGLDAIAAWEERGALDVPISINVAPEDALREGFAAELGEKIEERGVDPAHVRLEIPEAGVARDFDLAEARLGALRELGIGVALDDVGAGERSAVADLRRLPIDQLKVHRTFVLGMESSEGVAALVRGVVSLAGALGIETVAAGVESEGQLASLVEFGCSSVQGFMLSKPLEAEAFGRLLG